VANQGSEQHIIFLVPCIKQGHEHFFQGACGHPVGLFEKARKGLPMTPHSVIFQTFIEGLQWIGDELVPPVTPHTNRSESLIERA
jgi:hypothetical protein